MCGAPHEKPSQPIRIAEIFLQSEDFPSAARCADVRALRSARPKAQRLLEEDIPPVVRLQRPACFPSVAIPVHDPLAIDKVEVPNSVVAPHPIGFLFRADLKHEISELCPGAPWM